MPTKDTSEIKERIVAFLKIKGPSLPVHIAKEIGMNILFTSAFLSELLSDRKIKMSHMKVGSSKIHFLEGQEEKLENFSNHLKSREKDAYLLLKEKKFLKDSEVQPAIRVALRAIKDFAIPIETSEGIVWRYFTVPKSEFKEKEKPKLETKTPEVIEEKKPETKTEKPKTRKKSRSSRASSKKNDKFFNKVKDFLREKQIEITGIEGFSKKDLTLKVKKNEREYLLIAFNKKRVTEKDIIKAHKKASDQNLRYLILSLGEPLKKTQNIIEAAKDLAGIEKLE
jgi:hypothetical protein